MSLSLPYEFSWINISTLSFTASEQIEPALTPAIMSQITKCACIYPWPANWHLTACSFAVNGLLSRLTAFSTHLEHTHLIATRLHLWVSNPKKISFSISGMQTRLHALPHSSFKYSTCRHTWPVCHIALFYMLQADMAAPSATIHLSLSCIKTHLPSLPLFDVLNADTAAQSATFHLPVSFTKMWLTSRRHRKTGFFGMQTLWLIWSYPTLKYHTDADVDAPVSINHVCPLLKFLRFTLQTLR